MKTVFVFISSPSDAADERKRVVRLIERLNVDFADMVHLEPVRWEDRAYEAHEGFQEQIRSSTDCDVVIAVLRGRIGSPLSPEFAAHIPPEETLEGAKPLLTGTTYEIVTAIAARRHGKPLPDIYAFRYALAPAPALNAPDRVDIETQWKELEAFVAQVFITPEGYFKGALEPYHSIDEFEAKADHALRQWLEEKVIKGRALAWPIATKGSPFRGLEPFGAKHAEVFFGRRGDRMRAIERLKTLAEERFPLLVVVGPSGAGKSSFVRAGVVPALIKPGVVGGVVAWRVAVMRPSDGEDALDALARCLFDGLADVLPDDLGRPPALPELAEGDCARREDLRALFNVFARSTFANDSDRDAAREAITRPILRALARVAEAEKTATGAEQALPARLVIVVDQLDEIFAAQVLPERRAAFAKVLQALASTEEVWIVATVRAELFGAFLQSPFAELLQAKGTLTGPLTAEAAWSEAADTVERIFNLPPPSIADIGEIVRGPAEAAGLGWQKEPASGQRLDDRILADVDRPDLLPLIQFVLQQLFEQRETMDGSPTLTWAAYARIGSLDGAINTAANRALEGLDEGDRAALPGLLRALVAFPVADSGLSDPPPTLRRASLENVAHDAHGERLVKALTNARVLVSTRGEKGEPVVELAHQRVIEAWQTARAIIAENKTLLRIREDVDVACEAWLANGHAPDRLIPSGRRLADAEAAVAALKDELAPDRIDFVARSGRAARFRQRLTTVAAIVFFLMAVAAAASAYFFFDARNRAERNLVAAKQAIKSLDDFIWSANQGAQSMAGIRLDKVQASLGQIQRTLDTLSSESPDDLDLLAVRAGNFANFVDAYLTARSMKDAMTAADEGLATANRMAKLDADDPRTLKAQVIAAYKRADVRKEALDLNGAVADIREAERLAGILVAESATNPEALRLQWVATEKLGEALLAARNPGARTALEKATGLARSLMSTAPTDPARRRDVALSLASEGRAARAAGDQATAVSRFEDYLKLIERLTAEHPSDPLFRRDEAVALIAVGLAKFSVGDVAGANSDLNAALDIAKHDAGEDPLNARAKHDLLAVLSARAQVNLETDKAAARADLNEALQIARDFVAIDGTAARARYDLATVLMRLALNFDDARPSADEARSVIASLTADGLLTPADKATVAQFDQLMR